MNINDNKALQNLTDEFLVKFFELVHEENKKEKAESKHPQLISDKRDDSYAFNHMLPAYILQSNNAKFYSSDYPLVGSGFVKNACQEFFKHSIQGVSMDLKFIIANFKHQDDNLDFFARNYTTTSETREVNEINVDFILTGKGEKNKKVQKVFTTETMTIHNNKNNYIGKCVINSEDGELKNILLYGVCCGDGHKNNDLQLKIRCGSMDGVEEPTIEHFKYISDINSFFLMIEQIIYGIKDVLKSK